MYELNEGNISAVAGQKNKQIMVGKTQNIQHNSAHQNTEYNKTQHNTTQDKTHQNKKHKTQQN